MRPLPAEIVWGVAPAAPTQSVASMRPRGIPAEISLIEWGESLHMLLQ